MTEIEVISYRRDVCVTEEFSLREIWLFAAFFGNSTSSKQITLKYPLIIRQFV